MISLRLMIPTLTRLLVIIFLGLCAPSNVFAGEPSNIIELWPNGAPGEKSDIGEERDMTKPTDGLIAGKPVIRLGNVSKPTVSIYRPPADRATSAAVIVCPGG